MVDRSALPSIPADNVTFSWGDAHAEVSAYKQVCVAGSDSRGIERGWGLWMGCGGMATSTHHRSAFVSLFPCVLWAPLAFVVLWGHQRS